MTDEGCARDYMRMFETEGVEQRKRMSDLLTYRCLDTSAKGIFSAVVTDRKDFAVAKDEEAFFLRVTLVLDRERTQRALGGPEVYHIEPPGASYFGWIPERDFYAVTGAQFDVMVSTGKIKVKRAVSP
jgi:hypothetical protein